MSRRRWEADLAAAINDHDVVVLARDYMAWLTRAENALLPLRYRPGPFDAAGDVEAAVGRLTLARQELRPGTILDVVVEMAEFFIAAQSRLRSGELAPFLLKDHRLRPR